MIKQIQKWFRVCLAVMARGRTAHPMRQLKCFRGQLEVLVLMLVQPYPESVWLLHSSFSACFLVGFCLCYSEGGSERSL